MTQAKLTVLYPVPTDVEVFEKRYVEEHIPLVEEKIKGMTRMVLDVVAMAPGSEVQPYHRVAELFFPDTDTLQMSMMSEAGMAVAAHATEISTGGTPVLLISQSETRDF